jgi:hypothetical protein
MFLDSASDRYFCLSPKTERAFLAFMDGEEPEGGRETLVRSGLFVAVPSDVRPRPWAAPASPRDSLLDQFAPPSAAETAKGLVTIAQTALHLRTRGFASLLGSFARRKNAINHPPASTHDLAVLATSFLATRLLVAEHDHCLIRSFAVGKRLLAIDARPQIVLGVKLQPFKAHCWTQVDETLVNDRHDIVREFTPILSL